MSYDLVIHNGTVITVNAAGDIIEDGIVCIKGTLLEEIGPRRKSAPLPDAKTTIDARGGLVLPGLINTHTHLPMTLFRGLADDLPLDVWLNEHIFPAEQEHIQPETVRWGTLLGVAEMLLSGTTTCCDGYFYEDVVADAIADTGLRAVVGQGVIDFPAPGVPDPTKNSEIAVSFVNRLKTRYGRITPAIFCHSPYTCTPGTLKTAKGAATESGVLFQIHVAETQAEVDQCRAKRGMTPVAYLHQLGVLDKDTLLVHCVHLSAGDIERVASTGASVSHNPESNMKLAAGVAPVPELLKAGVTVGLGTDGCASNNNLDLFGEMDTMAKLHKVMGPDPTLLSARKGLEMATIDGARAIGLADVTGSLEKGKQADLIILDTDRPHLTPLYNPMSHLVYAARGSDVTHSIIGGQLVVADGCLKTVALDKIMAEARRIGKKVSAAAR